MIVYMLLGAGAGLGLVLIVAGLVPPRRDLAAAVGRWEVSRRHATRASQAKEDGTEPAGPAWQNRVGTSLADLFAKRGIEFHSDWRRDLAITHRTLEGTLAALAGYVVLGLVLSSLLAGLAAALGIPLGFAIPAGFGLFLGVLLVVIELRKITEEAKERRDELRAALGTYLNLISMCLAGGQGINQALPASANIGTGWTFETIKDAVDGARNLGLTPWESLGLLGEEYGISELTDLSSAAGLVGDSGAKVRASLNARAVTLRRRQLADSRTKADAASDSMSLIQVVIAFAFLGAILYPGIAAMFAAT